MKPNPYTQQKTREALILENAYLIKRVVRRMRARLPSHIEEDELYQAGTIGLIDALDKFDASRDVKLSTYAEFRIKGAILDELRSMDWAPRSVRSAGHRLEKAFTKLCNQFQRDPTDSEMARELEMSTKEYQEFVDKTKPLTLLSFEDLGGSTNDEGETTDILEVIADPKCEDPFELAELNQARAILSDAIKKLTEQEQLILSLYYMEEMNLKEVGAVLGVSESRVSQIRSKTILKLRALMKVQLENKKK